MSRRRKIVLACVTGVLLVFAFLLADLVNTWRHIPEAYAAWDTGSLLVVYMRTHENGWPSGWEDLLSVLEGERGKGIRLYGAQAGDMPYAISLQRVVAVDWSFDPRQVSPDSRPVTRLDGGEFSVHWAGGEPNKMVRRYLAKEMIEHRRQNADGATME